LIAPELDEAVIIAMLTVVLYLLFAKYNDTMSNHKRHYKASASGCKFGALLYN